MSSLEKAVRLGHTTKPTWSEAKEKPLQVLLWENPSLLAHTSAIIFHAKIGTCLLGMIFFLPQWLPVRCEYIFRDMFRHVKFVCRYLRKQSSTLRWMRQVASETLATCLLMG
jgi:hypothetical protein